MDALTRRTFLGVASLAGAGALAARAADKAAAPEPAAAPAPVTVPDTFPTQSPELAREMVGVSHGNVARVKELLKLHPTLSNANWDWGFGDWESALGAASHVGNREIAEALIASGARPTIFSATMLGQLAVVKAFVEASPGIQATLGPHSITLLAHARNGGEKAKPVLDYLTSVGGADPANGAVELPPELASRYTGTYTFGARDADRIEITFEKGGLRFARTGMSPRNLVHRGEHAFSPVGAPAVRVRFAVTGDAVPELSVFDPEVVLRAKRI
jgi:hypothetical protein